MHIKWLCVFEPDFQYTVRSGSGRGYITHPEHYNVPLYMFRPVGSGFVHRIWNETCCALASHVRTNFTKCYLPYATGIFASHTCSHHVALQGIVDYPTEIPTVYCCIRYTVPHEKLKDYRLMEVC